MALALKLCRIPACNTLLCQQAKKIKCSHIRLCTSKSESAEEKLKPVKSLTNPKSKSTFSWPDEEMPSTHSNSEISGIDSSRTTVSTKQKLSPGVVRENVKGYVFTRYFDYVKNYDKVLEKNFPSAMKVYRVFFDGVKEFYADMKRYLKITRISNTSPEGMKALNRKELELYMQMPRDMFKVAPAIILSSLPIVGYAIFPLVFMYPRTFLSAHFWTIQQRAEFQQLKMKERLSNNRPVFRQLQAKLHNVINNEHYTEFDNILGLIGSGFHPTVEAVLEIKDIFAHPPYNLYSLNRKHIKLLIKMHGMSGGLFKRRRLEELAFLIHFMDLAIVREGGIHNMPQEAIKYSCFIRGLNPSNLSNEEMIEWLRNWIQISTNIQQAHISLFLHLPLFLGYNHPNNWQLIYGDQKPKSGANKMQRSN
ncbi:LETM1 domain-containing protein 1 [Teleopsis dalmanni]|uniref:LETM1 domain-containing protein 1 n=1 Tax=Teleopsis dalmanni TaxID=139649 RepID=UPI0018CF2FA0|nr:LETM1 domain-containing protein 1 [Teleopsis dalmanni]